MRDGQWHHIVATYTKGDQRLYHNGDLSGTATYSGSLVVTSADAQIGGGQLGSYHTKWIGDVDEVLIFNRTLSAGEVLAIYNSSAYRYERNFTNLADRSYTLKGYAVDAAGNMNSTGLYNITVDTVKPVPAFVNPTPYNNSWVNTSIYANLTTSDNNGWHYAFTDFNNSIMSLWRLENNNNDDSGNARTLETYGSVEFVSGKIGLSAYFNGSSCLNRTGFLRYSPAATISGWVNIPSSSGDGTLFGQAYAADVYLSSGKVYFMPSTTNNEWSSGIYSDVAIPRDQWVHVVVIYNGSAAYMYINGTMQSQTKLISGAIYSPVSRNFRVGCDAGSGNIYNGFMTGSVDDLLVWNRSLSSTEISALYNAQSAKYQNNFTGLSDRSYTLKGYAVDAAGNMNSTWLYNITTDTVKPTPAFVSPTPANSSQQRRNYIYANLSSSDNNGGHYAFVNFNNSLVGWWRFEGSANDDSGRGNGGTWYGTQSYDVGKFGTAGSFDGSSYVRSSSGGIPTGNANRTITAWFKTNSVFGGGYAGWILGYGSTSLDNGFGIMVDIGGGLSFDSWLRHTYTNINVSNGQWQFVAVVINGSGNQVFLNGTLVGSDPTAINTASGTNFRIGERLSADSRFIGQIDDILVFNRSLNTSEILALYNAQSAQYQQNFTNLAEGGYSLNGYAVDFAGSVNSTGLYSITNYDTPPAIANITAYKSGQAASMLMPNDLADIRANVTDIDGAATVAGAKLSILDQSGAYNLTNATMVVAQSITNGSTYNYTFTVPLGAAAGTWTIRIYAYDTDGKYTMQDSTINVTTSHIIQLTLQLTGVSGLVAMGTASETAASSLSNTSSTAPSRFYTSSSSGGQLTAMASTGQTPISLDFARSGSSMHTISVSQYLSGSSAIVAFTRGTAADVDRRAAGIADGSFFANFKPTFGYGLGMQNPIKILLNYSNINIYGNITLRSDQTVVVENLGNTGDIAKVKIRQS
jgi:hypothetical protein